MSLSDSYSPRWLYLHEFALALAAPGADETELKDAIALLVRDRLIIDGRLNEAEFRFLEGRPDLRTTAWINKLSADDFNWALSEMLAGVDTSKPRSRISDTFGLLIEIAASALQYFGEPASAPPRKIRADRYQRSTGILSSMLSELSAPPAVVHPPPITTIRNGAVRQMLNAGWACCYRTEARRQRNPGPGKW